MFSKLLPKSRSDRVDIDPKLQLSKSVADINSMANVPFYDTKEKDKRSKAAKVMKAAFNALRSKKSRNKLDGQVLSDAASDYDRRSLRQELRSRTDSRSTLYHQEYSYDLESLPDRETIEALGSDTDVLTAPIDTEDLEPQDIIFAIMGATGVGKSSFINALAGGQSTAVEVGHTLRSCTNKISVVRIDIPATRFRLVLVDTPGFDDSHKNDSEILGIIADWVEKTYQRKVLLSGVIYLHRVTDNRFDAPTERTLRLFQSLLGTDNFDRVGLVTTMWDQLIDVDSEDDASRREGLLKSEHWYDLIQGGATTSQFRNSKESALDILWPLIEKTWNTRGILLLQDELCNDKKQLPKTEVGKQVFSRMDALLYTPQKRLNELRAMFFKL